VEDISYFYSLMAIALCVLVTLTVASEFYRGAGSFPSTPAKACSPRWCTHSPQHAPLWRIHRPLRRGGGHHRLCRAAFNLDKEQEMGYGDKMTIGPTL